MSKEDVEQISRTVIGGTVTDEQKIEVPLEDNHGQQLSKVITGLRPGILYAFRVYAENGVGVTYSGYQTVKIPVE